ncbi:CheR family methyltransferase [Aurantivibrio plasticivorans]
MVWKLQSVATLTDAEFEQWSKLLEARTGILLGKHQRAFLETQISMRMRELGFTEYSEYYTKLGEGVWGKAEWSVLVDRLMVKETSFFRHKQSYECVRRLLQDRIDKQQLSGSFDVWSVGCSTGEEPYSLAMLFNDCFELAKLKPYFGVFATDISLPALSRAREGIYPKRKLERLSAQEVAHYFIDLGDGNYQVKEKLRDRLCFSQGSVLEENIMPAEKMDVIYCQNVLIYFRRWRRRDILKNLVDHLKPGGLLVIGLGEMVDWRDPDLERHPDESVQAYIKR